MSKVVTKNIKLTKKWRNGLKLYGEIMYWFCVENGDEFCPVW